MTILVVGVLMAYASYKAIILVGKTDTKTTSNVFIKAVNYTNPEMLQVNDLGFDLAYELNVPMTPNYGIMTLNYETDYRIKNNVTGEEEQIFDSRELDVIRCGESYFNYTDVSEINKKGINEYWCLKNKSEMLIGGLYFSDIFKSINL
jgi:hypothetical protein